MGVSLLMDMDAKVRVGASRCLSIPYDLQTRLASVRHIYAPARQ